MRKEYMTDQEIEAVANEEKAAETDQSLPTGRCRIAAGSVQSRTDGLTQRSCYAVAARVGGVADWAQGARCP